MSKTKTTSIYLHELQYGDVEYIYTIATLENSSVKQMTLNRVYPNGSSELLLNSSTGRGFGGIAVNLDTAIPPNLVDKTLFKQLISTIDEDRKKCLETVSSYLLGNYTRKYKVDDPLSDHLSDYIHGNKERYIRQIGEYTVVYTVPNESNGVDLSYRAFELLGNGGIILVADDTDAFQPYRPIENIDGKFFLNLVRTAMACEYDSDDFDTEKECNDAYENYAEKESEIYRHLLEF